MEHQLKDFPSQPTGGDMRTIESDYLPVLTQTAPVDAKELHEAFDSNLLKFMRGGHAVAIYASDIAEAWEMIDSPGVVSPLHHSGQS